MGKKIVFTATFLLSVSWLLTAPAVSADAPEQLKQAEQLFKKGQYEQAEAIYQQVAAEYPGTDHAFEAQKKLTILYIATGKQPQANAAYQQLITDFSNNEGIPEAVRQVARQYQSLKKYKKALELHQHVVDSFPGSEYEIWSQRSVAALNLYLGDEAAATACAEELFTNFSGHQGIAKAAYHLGRDCLALKKYEKARGFYQYVLDNFPNNKYAISAQTGVAISNIALGNDQAATAATEKLLTDFSGHAGLSEAVYRLADEYRISKKYEKAGELCQYILDKFPGDDYAMRAQMAVAISNIALGNDDVAEAATEKLLTNFSGHKDLAEAVHLIASDYRHLQKYEKACQLHQYVLENFPDSESAMWSQRGLAVSNIALGNDDVAQAATEKLLANFSGHAGLAEAVYRLADDYRNLKSYEKASELYQYVVNNFPGDKDAMRAQMGLALSNITLGNDDVAEAATEKLLTNFSGHKDLAEAVHLIASNYRHLQKYEKACQLHQYVLENFPDSESAMWSQRGLAVSNIALGNDDVAQAATEKLLDNFSGHAGLAEAVYRLADDYRKLKRYEQAKRIYQLITDDYPATGYAQKAQLNVPVMDILTLVDSGNDDQVMAAIDTLIADFNDHPNLPAAISSIEEGYYTRILAAGTWLRENYLHPVIIWEKAISKFPEFFHSDPDLYYFIACCYYQVGQYEKAIEYCNIVINNWPHHKYGRRDARYLIDDSLDKLGQSRK